MNMLLNIYCFFFMSIILINYIILFIHLIIIIINLLFIYNLNVLISNYFNAILYGCSTQNCVTSYIIKKLFLLFSFNINIFHFFMLIYMTIPLVITGTIKFSGKIILKNIPVSNLWIFLLFTKKF